jgi:hypothetical protein
MSSLPAPFLVVHLSPYLRIPICYFYGWRKCISFLQEIFVMLNKKIITYKRTTKVCRKFCYHIGNQVDINAATCLYNVVIMLSYRVCVYIYIGLEYRENVCISRSSAYGSNFLITYSKFKIIILIKFLISKY